MPTVKKMNAPGGALTCNLQLSIFKQTDAGANEQPTVPEAGSARFHAGSELREVIV